MTDTSHHHRRGTGTRRRPRAAGTRRPRRGTGTHLARYVPVLRRRAAGIDPRLRIVSSPVRSDSSRTTMHQVEGPTASAIIASASVQGAPRIRVHVEAYEAASVEALPDTGADVSVAGLQLLDDMGEFPENLLPPDEHPKAANGEVIKSIGVLPVHITLGDTTVEDNIHILPSVTGLLLSWKTTRKLNLIPEDYPRQMKSTRGLSSDAAGDASKRQDAPPTAVLGVGHRAERQNGSEPLTAPSAPHPAPRDTACPAGTDAASVIDTARHDWSSDAAVAPPTAPIEEEVAPSGPPWPSVAEWSEALESDASAGGESPVRAPVRAATLCPYA